MARYFTTNQLEYLARLLGGWEPRATLATLFTTDGPEEVAIYGDLEEAVDEALMEVFGYGLQDMPAFEDGQLYVPPWRRLEMPWRRLSRPERGGSEDGRVKWADYMDMSVNPTSVDFGDARYALH